MKICKVEKVQRKGATAGDILQRVEKKFNFCSVLVSQYPTLPVKCVQTDCSLRSETFFDI